MESFLDLVYLPTASGGKFFVRALTIVDCVDYVVGQDDEYCMTSTMWRQAASLISRLVC